MPIMLDRGMELQFEPWVGRNAARSAAPDLLQVRCNNAQSLWWGWHCANRAAASGSPS